MPSRPVSLIAAVASDGGIGLRGELLVRIPDDLRRFKALTTGAAVVMGRKTWESIGRPLPHRRNIVVTRNPAWRAEGAEVASSVGEALAAAGNASRVFVIGGGEIYAEALPLADRLDLTEIDTTLPADAWFPKWERADFELVASDARRTEAGLAFAFNTYRRIDRIP